MPSYCSGPVSSNDRYRNKTRTDLTELKMPSGFIYILINPAMPGLAKVGKTTRQPKFRVTELSSATGIPTPFLLAYEHPVVDCDGAEKWVHAELERAGYRHTQQREFFNAPLHLIVKIVAQSDGVRMNTDDSIEVDPLISNEYPGDLADELVELGHTYADGTDTVLRNPAKALKYYEQAAALGHVDACSMAGSYYRWGLYGVREDLEKALEYYNRSTASGNWHDYALLAGMFLETGQYEAAKKHWNSFFDAARDQYDEVCDMRIRMYGVWYCKAVAEGEINHCVDDSTIKHFSVLLLEGISRQSDKLNQESDKGLAESQRKSLSGARNFICGITQK